MKGTKTEIRPGVWRLRVYVGRRSNGSPIQTTKTFRSPEAIERGDKCKPGAGTRLADDELAAMIAKANKGTRATGTETVGDLLDQWLEHCDSLGRSPTTMRKYKSIVDAVIRPDLGRLRLSKLTARDLDSLYSKLTARGNKATTVRRVHALIGAALHQAEKWDLVDRNVARRASPPPVHSLEVQAPSPSEVQALVKQAEETEPELAPFLLIAALTGCRRGELCALRWTDLDSKAGVLTVSRSVYETAGGGWAEKPTKTHQVRRVGLDDLAIEVLRRLRESVDQLAEELGLEVLPDGFIFSKSPVGAEPMRPDVVTKATARVAKKAKIDTHLHALRHFSATQLIADGHDVRTVAGRLGHADASVTLRVYSHVLPQQDRDAAAALGRALSLPS